MNRGSNENTGSEIDPSTCGNCWMAFKITWEKMDF